MRAAPLSGLPPPLLPLQVRVYSAGYPDRLPIKEFIGRFRNIVPRDRAPQPPPLPDDGAPSAADAEAAAQGRATAWERGACAALLEALGVDPKKEAALGHTKVFLRAGVAARLQVMMPHPPTPHAPFTLWHPPPHCNSPRTPACLRPKSLLPALFPPDVSFFPSMTIP